MTIRKTVLGLAIAAVLAGMAGCASVDQTEAIKSEVPAEFKVAEDQQPVVSLDPLWWESLQDKQLNDLVAMAKKSNSDIQVAAAQLLSAQAVLKGSEASFFPIFDLAMHSSKDRQASGMSDETAISKTKSASVAMSYELDIWGRIHDIRDSKKAALEATEQDTKSVELTVVSSVVNGYLLIRQLDEEINALREMRENGEKILAIRTFSAKEGYSNSDEVEKSKETLAKTSISLERKQEDRAKAENALAVLVGDPLHKISADSQYHLVGLRAPAPGVPSELLSRRPDLIKAEKELAGAHANVAVARKAFFPQISLTSSIGSQSGELSNLMRSGSDIWSYGFGLDLPIFDGGLRLSNLLKSEAQEKEAVAQYQKSIRVAFSEVNDALVSLSANKRVHEQSQIALSSSTRTLALVTDRYQHGYSSYADMLSEADNMLNNRLTEIQNRYEISKDIVLFNKSLGI